MIKEIVNVSLLQGNIGRPGAGLCPVRGHSNVQGDRTMGVWERMPDRFLDALRDEFGFEPPREHGFDTVDAIRAMRDGKVRVFLGLGGNFVSAAPDTEVTERAMRNCALTVHVSTKLNRSHVVTGGEALILPVLGRSEQDFTGGRRGASPSRTRCRPCTPRTARSSRPRSTCARRSTSCVPWRSPRCPTPRSRGQRCAMTMARSGATSRVVPGCAAYDDKVDQPGGFVLPHPPRDSRIFETSSGKAVITSTPIEVLEVDPGRLLLQTLRSHDQFNTTIYGLDDRYRGIKGGRRVVFVHPDDIGSLGWQDGDMVDLVGEWEDGERIARDFRIVSYDQPRGCAAACYPETNPLVPLDSTAEGSNTPTSKSVVVRLETPGYESAN